MRRDRLGAQIDRMGRAQINTLLTDPFDSSASTRGTKADMYSLAAPGGAPSFEAMFETSLGIFDGLDGTCGNQLLAGNPVTASRYKQHDSSSPSKPFPTRCVTKDLTPPEKVL